jgi:hypothetical protein
MKAITLRNLPPELVERIEQESAQRGTSLNKTVIRLLEEALLRAATEQKHPVHHDLDSLAGSWSQQEADEFDQALGQQRSIDKELWD